MKKERTRPILTRRRIITAAFGGSGIREEPESEFASMVPPDAEGEDPYNAQAAQIYVERRDAARAEYGEGVEAEEAREATPRERRACDSGD